MAHNLMADLEKDGATTFNGQNHPQLLRIAPDRTNNFHHIQRLVRMEEAPIQPQRPDGIKESKEETNSRKNNQRPK